MITKLSRWYGWLKFRKKDVNFMERYLDINTNSPKWTSKKLAVVLGLPGALALAAFIWLFRRGGGVAKSEKTGDSKSKRIRKGLPPGLINLGNTCFINCLLQAVASLNNFCKWIDDFNQDKEKILLSSLKEIIPVLNNKRGIEKDLFSAMDVIESLSAHGWVGTLQQQDAYEFFQILMSTLDDELILDSEDCPGFPYERENSEFLKNVYGRVCREIPAKNLASPSPFKGILANRMTCLKCGYQSVGFDPFESISVRIPKFTALAGAKLENCIAEFTKSEHVDDVNCPGCTRNARSSRPVKSSFSKQLSFAKLPKCLCIHIQRSYFLPNGYSYKNSQFVRYSDVIDLNAYRYNTFAYNNRLKSQKTSSLESQSAASLPLRGGSSNFHLEQASRDSYSSKSCYRLNAVVVHIGDTSSGHFVTYRRAVKTEDNWVYSSDEYTKPASKQSVLSSNAYLLFYEKIADSQ
ncbi:ubiquitin carboxyl-terminal hydrolase 30-like [Rhopilema esculentum]|uniref:ubiquitin carboxyl-terminal hydrolase 30-like n=1 Tax=Rhopilema esculentum TaxID=499914 RepID=UPI0031DC0837